MLIRNLSLFLFFLAQMVSVAQVWEPDLINNLGVDLIRSGKKLGLVRNCGDGKRDTVAPAYELIFKYEPPSGNFVYLGRKDSVWYKINFTGKAAEIPYKTYLGKGLFFHKSGKLQQIYSLDRGLLLSDSISRLSEYFDNITYYNSSSYIIKHEDYAYQTGCFNAISFGFAAEYPYCMESNGVVALKDLNMRVKHVSGKPSRYGLYMFTYTNSPQLLPAVYDSIASINSIIIAKKGKTYEVYNGVMKRLPDSDQLPTLQPNGMVEYAKNRKRGLMDVDGKEVLPCIYDRAWVDKLIFARLKDSLYCYDGKKQIITIGLQPDAVTEVQGSYESVPLILTELKGGERITRFLYNPLNGKVLDPSGYDTTYFFDVAENDYYLIAKKNGRYGIINFDNKIVKPFEYDYIGRSMLYNYTFSVNFHLLKKNGKIGFISNSLKEYIPTEYDAVSGLIEESRTIPDRFLLKKDKLWYLYDYKNKQFVGTGYDTIRFAENKYYGSGKKQNIIVTKNGVSFLIDSTGRKYYDFRNVQIRENGMYVVLEDTSLNKTPQNITPLASINHVEDFNAEHSYALVYCLNRYFIVNKYGEMSSGFEASPDFYDYENNLIFGKKLKKAKTPALYDVKGNEVGKLSAYKGVYQEYDMVTKEMYYLFYNSKNEKGLMNTKGELLLQCNYLDIGTISSGECQIWLRKGEDPYMVDLKKLKPLGWK